MCNKIGIQTDAQIEQRFGNKIRGHFIFHLTIGIGFIKSKLEVEILKTGETYVISEGDKHFVKIDYQKIKKWVIYATHEQIEEFILVRWSEVKGDTKLII